LLPFCFFIAYTPLVFRFINNLSFFANLCIFATLFELLPLLFFHIKV